MKVGLIQRFGIGENGGGPKILRSLVFGQPFEWQSVCTQIHRPCGAAFTNGFERWIPARPATKLDRTRLHWLADSLSSAFVRRLRAQILAVCDQERFDVVHIIPHDVHDWQFAAEYCFRTGTPLLMSVHDDIRYTFSPRAYRKQKGIFADVWRKALHVFCISQELGEEYCQRFGKRQFETLTDGVEPVACAPRPRRPAKLHVYFCGLLHYGYVENFQVLYEALESLASEYDVKIVIRGGMPFRELKPYRNLTEYLSFADDFSGDFERVDALYLPLPFGQRYKDFVRYSLSTKLVSYIAAGLPILYHGPPDSALYRLLNRYKAACAATTNTVADLQRALRESVSTSGRESVEQALSLARSQFSLAVQRDRFLQALLTVGGERAGLKEAGESMLNRYVHTGVR
jgi:glycosyltransferase involved in cell wall biosynthesis